MKNKRRIMSAQAGECHKRNLNVLSSNTCDYFDPIFPEYKHSYCINCKYFESEKQQLNSKKKPKPDKTK